MYDELLAVSKYGKLFPKFISGTLTVTEIVEFLSVFYFLLEQRTKSAERAIDSPPIQPSSLKFVCVTGLAAVLH